MGYKRKVIYSHYSHIQAPVAINATQLIAIKAATVRQRVNAGTAVHAHNIFLRHLGTFITNTMVCCKLVSLNVVL
jgi:hypothetical protein